jgi:Plavaka transposase
MVHDPPQATPTAADSEEWQAEDDGWIRRAITISVPFPCRFLHPGPRNYTIYNFYRRSLLSIIRETVSDPIRCRSFHFEPYSLRWKCLCRVDDIGVYGELFSSQAFITAHRDLQDVHLDSTSCALPRCIVALMFWSDATQLTTFGDAKLWPLYVYFGNESKHQRCTPSANLCSHAAYFQSVCFILCNNLNLIVFQSSYPIISRTS